jgi:AraC family ethanolamine operon transcriptional activator
MLNAGAMPPGTGAAAVRQQAFHDVEELRQQLAALGLPLELIQLAGGRLEGQLLALALGPVQLLVLEGDRPLHARGTKRSGERQISLSLDPPGRLPTCRSHGQLLPERALFGLEPGGEVHLSAPAGTRLVVLGCGQACFTQWCQELGWEELAGPPGANWLPLDPTTHDRLRRWLGRLFSRARSGAALAAQPALEGLMPLLLEAMARGGNGSSLQRLPARIAMVKEVQAWMEQHPEQPLALRDLCRRVYVSRRSLIQGFQEHLGMGPAAYHRVQRLHGARRALLAADPAAASVTAIAARHGFLNPGHFARDYRLQFGELPSASLRTGRRCS